MNIKLIAMDMDGTLLDSNKKISEKTKDKLIELQKQGVRLVLSSGRSKNRLEEFAFTLKMEQYGGYIIEANGAGIFDFKNNKRIILRRLYLQEAEEIFNYIKELYPNVEILVMADRNAYTYLPKCKNEKGYFDKGNMESVKNREIYKISHVAQISEELNKICIFTSPEEVDEIAAHLDVFKDRYWYGRTLPVWLEIGPKEVTKGNALLKIMEELEIDKVNVVAFGDGENDLSMLKIVHGVAMDNAIYTVKDACEFQTLSNDNEGIVNFLEKHGY